MPIAFAPDGSFSGRQSVRLGGVTTVGPLETQRVNVWFRILRLLKIKARIKEK